MMRDVIGYAVVILAYVVSLSVIAYCVLDWWHDGEHRRRRETRTTTAASEPETSESER
jgi:hypothetical protein